MPTPTQAPLRASPLRSAAARRAMVDGWHPSVSDPPATAIPSIVVVQPDAAGPAQRRMFLVAYAWYGSAAWGLADRS